METNKEAERMVIAKPVASRPTFCTVRSFSEPLAAAINESTPKIGFESDLAPIKPKTVRFKPLVNRTSAAIFSSQAEISGTTIYNSVDRKIGWLLLTGL
ncbi:WRKY transcription factor 44-like [Syzygium oleosum]|uniref:WRKY transcription factor 44-like n=1 Tax=Syzygium oleosum TaxID=219896 RepID=UPI0024BBA961|nr:WRKY transcription factor 44-like [Syzygium oleosum]